jgi:predicted Zn-dependent protease
LFLVFLLIAGAIGAWIVLFQPFAVPDITQPQQHFQNPSLGVSLQYPSGWTTQMDAKTGAVYFYDSTHTDQVNIVTVAANGTDPGQYLQKEATQLGITALKTKAPASFAGTTWQQAQGILLQNGANYTETLFVTLHNQRFYTFMQIAPQSTYNDEERLVFSSMRSTFQFMS